MRKKDRAKLKKREAEILERLANEHEVRLTPMMDASNVAYEVSDRIEAAALTRKSFKEIWLRGDTDPTFRLSALGARPESTWSPDHMEGALHKSNVINDGLAAPDKKPGQKVPFWPDF